MPPPCTTVQCCVDLAGIDHLNALAQLVNALTPCMSQALRDAFKGSMIAAWNKLAGDLISIGNNAYLAGKRFNTYLSEVSGIASGYVTAGGNCWDEAWGAFLVAIVAIRQAFLDCLAAIP